MAKEKILPIERMILNSLKFRFNNPKIKINDLLEWNTSEATIDKNLRPNDGEIKMECCGVWIAVKSELDKSKK
jgi:hypothetical protein